MTAINSNPIRHIAPARIQESLDKGFDSVAFNGFAHTSYNAPGGDEMFVEMSSAAEHRDFVSDYNEGVRLLNTIRSQGSGATDVTLEGEQLKGADLAYPGRTAVVAHFDDASATIALLQDTGNKYLKLAQKTGDSSVRYFETVYVEEKNGETFTRASQMELGADGNFSGQAKVVRDSFFSRDPYL